MLSSYLSLTQSLLQSPPAPVTLYTTANLTTYVNIARGQVAGEGKCIRSIGTVSTVIGQRAYNFSSINFGTAATTGIQGAINVKRIMYNVGTGQKWVLGKSWEWFDFQRFNNPVPNSGAPMEWAQLSQGSAGQGAITGVGAGAMASGSFYVDPLPDTVYTLNCDCECYPQQLAADTDVEALPYLWTDAVPYFAAYMALLTAQTSARLQQAQQYLQLYRLFMQRARASANPDQNQGAFEQAPDPTMAGRFGITGGAGNGAAQ